MNNEKCCVVGCDLPLDQTYWENQYLANATGWDLGQVSPPIASYIDTIETKNAKILIPGCGNTYEAEYLLEKGFTNITVIDIAPTLVENLNFKFIENQNVSVILGDFFEHQGTYDYIIEQTFFCAIPPTMRQKYVWKMHQLLTNNGKLVGLLFNRGFDVSPPFGGNLTEYKSLFQESFEFIEFETAKNSFVTRNNTELFIEFKKNDSNIVTLYHFEGITCNGCMNTVSTKFLELDGVENVSMNKDFSEIIIASKTEIDLEILQKIISYDKKYRIKKS